MYSDDIVKDFLEIKLVDDLSFRKIRETLTRIGIASQQAQSLSQSCHIFHRRGKYYITHFIEMFMLDGKASALSEDDKARRNTIAFLLQEWELLEILDEEKYEDLRAPISAIKIIPFRDKTKWNLIPKYSIGSNSNR